MHAYCLPLLPLCRYPGTCTLPDGKVLIVGGVKRNGQSGYGAKPELRPTADNPTYNVRSSGVQCLRWRQERVDSAAAAPGVSTAGA